MAPSCAGIDIEVMLFAYSSTRVPCHAVSERPLLFQRATDGVDVVLLSPTSGRRR